MFPLIFILLSLASTRIVQIIEVFRHGARGPLKYYYDADQQEYIFGYLIPSGMRQHYNLGRQLREEYIEQQTLLSPFYNHSEIYIRSTGSDRTVMSAQCQLMGLYPYNTGPELPANLNHAYKLPAYSGANDTLQELSALPYQYQAIPVHEYPDEIDEIFKPSCDDKSDLQKLDKKEAQVRMDEIWNDKYNQIQEICKLFNETQCETMTDIHSLYSTYTSDIYQARFVPQLTDEQLNLFMLISTYQMYIKEAGVHYGTVKSTALMKNILQIFNSKIKNPKSLLKLLLYSTHDTNIIAYLSFFNFSSELCNYEKLKYGNTSKPCQFQPEYAANMIFELHQDEYNQSQYFIKIRYNGEYQNLCGSQETECNFELFSEIVQNQMYSDSQFQEVCFGTKFENDEFQFPALNYLDLGTIFFTVVSLGLALKLRE